MLEANETWETREEPDAPGEELHTKKGKQSVSPEFQFRIATRRKSIKRSSKGGAGIVSTAPGSPPATAATVVIGSARNSTDQKLPYKRGSQGSSQAGEESLERDELLSVFQIRPESFRQNKLKT